jgi:hypothetical protein
VQTWWTAFPQGVSAYFNGLANLAWVKLNAIDSAGRYQDTNNTNLVEEPIKIVMKEGLVLDMGTKNMLSSSNLGGANAGARGGNATTTLSYTNFNDLSVSHPRDPTVALRP